MPVTDTSISLSEPEPLLENAPDQRLVEFYAPCFTHILQMQATTDLGEPDALRSYTKELIETCEHAALQNGVDTKAVAEAKYAVVAFIDETILSSDWSGADQWMNTPLQLEFYDQFDAGEVFFDRLYELLDEPNAHAEALEVYHLCMALGFQGKYQLQDQERLRELIETTGKTLSEQPTTRADALAPHGQPRTEPATERRTEVPTWVIATVATLLVVVLYGGMHLYLSSTAHQVARVIRQLGGG
jgi:type VI secretion system protein ImpK